MHLQASLINTVYFVHSINKSVKLILSCFMGCLSSEKAKTEKVLLKNSLKFDIWKTVNCQFNIIFMYGLIANHMPCQLMRLELLLCGFCCCLKESQAWCYTIIFSFSCKLTRSRFRSTLRMAFWQWYSMPSFAEMSHNSSKFRGCFLSSTFLQACQSHKMTFFKRKRFCTNVLSS